MKADKTRRKILDKLLQGYKVNEIRVLERLMSMPEFLHVEELVLAFAC